MLPCSVRLMTLPLPKSMVTMGTGRTISQTGSKFKLIIWATSGEENNTVLAKRALVQQNCLSSWPIMWNSNTGLPDFFAAAQASAKLLCQFTSPALTVGLSAVTGTMVVLAGAGPVFLTMLAGPLSIRTVLVISAGVIGAG